jgi:hypothetical protein
MVEGVALGPGNGEMAGADAIPVPTHISNGHREGLLQPDRLFYPEPNQLVFDMLKESGLEPQRPWRHFPPDLGG